nr:immunoglobulin heavy chain junction region [Macaca mulatta]
CARKEDDLYLW